MSSTHSPFLCRIAHRWRNLDGSKPSGHSDEKCIRCDLRRDYYGTYGYGCYGLPYFAKDEHKSTTRSLSLMDEVIAERDELAIALKVCQQERDQLRADLAKARGEAQP